MTLRADPARMQHVADDAGEHGPTNGRLQV
jgi:hypothetical protein